MSPKERRNERAAVGEEELIAVSLLDPRLDVLDRSQ